MGLLQMIEDGRAKLFAQTGRIRVASCRLYEGVKLLKVLLIDLDGHRQAPTA